MKHHEKNSPHKFTFLKTEAGSKMDRILSEGCLQVLKLK